MKTIYVTPCDDLNEIIGKIDCPTTLCLKNGVYRQKVKLDKSDVILVGESREGTIITFDDYAKKIHADGREFITFRTYTLLVCGENCRIENLTIENSNPDPRIAGQCVALSVNAKRFYAENVALKSMQDTLFSAPFPDDLVVRYRDFLPREELYIEGDSLHFFYKCAISGTVDFIFGGATAYFYQCEIISLKDQRDLGFVAAPCHSLAYSHGLTFVDCDIVSGGATDGSVYLARPWRDFGKAEFINCRLGSHIKSELYDKWNDTERDKSARFAHFNLKSELPLTPVKWSTALDEATAQSIIECCESIIKQHNK